MVFMIGSDQEGERKLGFLCRILLLTTYILRQEWAEDR